MLSTVVKYQSWLLFVGSALFMQTSPMDESGWYSSASPLSHIVSRHFPAVMVTSNFCRLLSLLAVQSVTSAPRVGDTALMTLA